MEIPTYPVLEKSIEKITLYNSVPKQYALYIKDTDRFIILPENEIDHIISMSKLTNGSHSVDELINDSDYSPKENIRILILMNKLHLFDKNMSSKQFSEASLFSKKIASFNFSLSDKASKAFYYCYWSILFFAVIISVVIPVVRNINLYSEFLKVWNSFDGISYILSIVLIIPLFIVHEFAHVATSFKYNLNKGIKINLALYFFVFPFVYVKIPGLYTLETKKRIHILISGVFSNVLLGILFIMLSIISHKDICFAISLSNFQIAFVNLIPFNLTDGYFILSNILKRANIRKKYFQFISEIGKKRICKPDKIELLYIIISVIYLLLLSFIEFELYSSAFLNNLSILSRALLSILFTIIAACLYIVFVKLRMKKSVDIGYE